MTQFGNEYSISNALLLEERDCCDRFIEDLKKLPITADDKQSF
jgi:hypothetical protein